MLPRESDSSFVRHLACDNCGSRDANALYDDGHTTCFSCGRYVPSADETTKRSEGNKRLSGDFLMGQVQALSARGLTEETCRKFGYRVTKDGAKPVQVADYRDAEGALVAQKVRDKDKNFKVIGSGKDMPLFGAHLWQSGGKRIVITEGEIDAMSVSQAFGNSWPAVSLPNGAQSAKHALQRALEYLESFDQVVLCFDMDEPGRKAVAECAPLFSPGKCAVAELPHKDANAMLQEGLVKELCSAVYQARIYRPDGIVSLSDIRDRVMAPPEMGRPWFLESVTKATFGRRLGDLVAFGGGTGCGKTDLLTQQVAYDVLELGIPTGLLLLEQDVGETGKRLAGKAAGKRFHVPDGSWVQAELEAAYDALAGSNKVHLYDNFGAMGWGEIKSRIRYLVRSLGCQHIWLDHLTALAAAEEDERRALDKILAEMASMAKELQFVFHFVSHLATPEVKPHEEGGRVQVKHFRGSRAIGFWCHSIFGIERDTQQPGTPAVWRSLKDRFTGQANGLTWGLSYDANTGRLSETELNADFPDESGDGHDF
jgi:twinkle protein